MTRPLAEGSSLRVHALHKALAGVPVLHGVDLEVPSGSIVALLGASGSGKTTLLRLIAGFEAADAGSITMGDRVLERPGLHVPAERRRIGYVPQEGTLFPHLTVAGNVGFGLSRAERRGGRVAEALALTGLQGLEGRYPHQLSGGQQQRTALARALAPRPGLVLLDEPFNALDLALRRSVCADVVALLRQNQATAILVTHDPQEAFATADLIAVMRAGLIAQCADPATLYRRPVSAEVARLTGAAVLLPGEAEGGWAQTALGRLPLLAEATGRVTVMLRPDQIVPADPGEGVRAQVLRGSFYGDHTLMTVRVDAIELDIRLSGHELPGDSLEVAVRGGCMTFVR